MHTPQYLTVFLIDEGHHQISIFTEKMTQLGHATLTEYDEGFLEVNTAVARPGMGTLLYQQLAKYAGANKKHIMPDRSGDTREAAMVKWREFYSSLHESLSPRLPDELNENIIEMLGEDEPYLLHGYCMPADTRFMSGLKHISEVDNPGEVLRMIGEAKDWFSDAYGQDSNKFIDEFYPYPIDDPRTEFPKVITLPVGAVSIDKDEMLSLLNDSLLGQYSQSTGNITAIIDLQGDIIIDEGHHRFFEQILLHKKDVQVTLISDERLHGRQYDLIRPDKSKLFKLTEPTPYCGVESLLDMEALYALTQQYCQYKGLNTPPLCLDNSLANTAIKTNNEHVDGLTKKRLR